MDQITILMSTYNGEKFLRPQLDSIFSQENVDIHLLIRDDGSVDSTLSILRKYERIYPDKVKILPGENIGWKKSFRTLLDYAAENFNGCNYFAFADQDDIWLPAKLEKAISNIKEHAAVPVLYYSNLFFYKNEINEGLIHKTAAEATFKNCLARNYATGCTIVFNSRLLECLSHGTPCIDIPHDHWAYMVAVLCGKVIYDSDSYILYRQHDSNQIGSKHGLFDVWKARFKRFSQPELDNIREKTAKELLRIHASDMYPEARKAVEKLAGYKDSISNRLRLLFDSGYTLNNLGNDFFFKLRIIFGKL
ncbi:MAG: glycosyltransferase family 2 protein [Bacteroides sp.]|nr:glycosyltransferase family 2 protein [Bacteroides sp.]